MENSLLWKQRNMTAEVCDAFDDSDDLPDGVRRGASGDMLSTFLHVNGAHKAPEPA